MWCLATTPGRRPARAPARQVAALLLVALLVALGSAACTGTPGDDRPPATGSSVAALDVAWEELALPGDRGHRATARDLTWCGDHWLVVGGVFGPAGRTRPAAWTSPDGQTWRELRFRTSTYWGARAVLSSVACRGEVPVAVGAMSGGAHGNPRVATFRPAARGAWVDVPAPFEQYGGPSAINVGDVAAGPAGWLIAGNRRSGPAVWTASSPRRFDLVEGAPGLVGDGADAPLAQGVAWDGSAWIVVGGSTAGNATDRVPVAWRSTNGRDWTRESLPDTPDYEDVHQAAVVDGALVAVGLRGTGFGSWVRDEDGWRAGGTFGENTPDAGRPPSVVGLATGHGNLLAGVSDGSRFHLWGSTDGLTWRQVELPVSLESAADQALAVGGSESGVLLVADTADGSRAWRAPWPDLGER